MTILDVFFFTITYRIIICWFIHSFIYLFVIFLFSSIVFSSLICCWNSLKKTQHVVLKKTTFHLLSEQETCWKTLKAGSCVSIPMSQNDKEEARTTVATKNGRWFSGKFWFRKSCWWSGFVEFFLGIRGVIKITFFEGDQMGVSKNRGTPKWMIKIMENLTKMNDLVVPVVPLFSETPK